MGGATSRVYGILPFGLRHPGAPICQNRITGDPRTPSGRYILGLSVPYRTGPPARIPSRRRKASGTSQHVDDRTCGCRTTVSCARRSRPGPPSPRSPASPSAWPSAVCHVRVANWFRDVTLHLLDSS
ncbi:hypothetical protein CQW39_14270 [Streptomyces griseofuscus]|uniref:Uncharacterized protein n=1 Tax=Streptomyces griseofuscus TaxID=146922 RepID=A0A426S3B2_9ACTN|nr:hypothetical protein CQW39_14270 [Streptomyces griseofuscus]RRQ84042.1 hypothetical protein CQW44_22765 [Streptomyces griseofuscus]